MDKDALKDLNGATNHWERKSPVFVRLCTMRTIDGEAV